VPFELVTPERMNVGDVRFERSYADFLQAADRAERLSRMSDEEVVEALAAASRANDPLIANILATEASNRMRRLRASLANLGEAVITAGPEGVVRWANPAAERLLGLPRDRLLGQHLTRIVQAASGDLFAGLLEGHMGMGDADQIRCLDGRELDVTYTAATIPGPSGEDAGIVITLADRTAQRRQERALRESEQRFHSLFANFPDAIVAMDVRGTILDANEGAVKLMGVPLSEARGRPFSDLLDDRDLPRLTALFLKVAEGKVGRADVHFLRNDGKAIHIDAAGIPIIVDGDVVGIHGLARVMP
jgi:PAS domain S-box-containing protein